MRLFGAFRKESIETAEIQQYRVGKFIRSAKLAAQRLEETIIRFAISTDVISVLTKLFIWKKWITNIFMNGLILYCILNSTLEFFLPFKSVNRKISILLYINNFLKKVEHFLLQLYISLIYKRLGVVGC